MSRTRDRWYVQKDKHAVYQRWTKGEDALFKSMADLFVFSAAYGFHMGVRSPLEGEKQHTGVWGTFTESRDQPLLQAIAIAATDGLEVLDDLGDVITIAEEYANGGFPLVQDLDRHDLELTISALATEVLTRGRASDGLS